MEPQVLITENVTVEYLLFSPGPNDVAWIKIHTSNSILTITPDVGSASLNITRSDRPQAT